MKQFEIGSLTVEVVDDPALTLPELVQKRIATQCIPVARTAFKNDGITASDVIKHCLQVPLAVFVRNEAGDVIGFSSAVVETVGEHRVLYLEGTAVAPSMHGRGLYGLVTPLRILHGVKSAPAANWLLSTRTQSPTVFRNTTHKRKYALFPRPHYNEATPAEIGELAEQFAAVVREEYSDFKTADGLQFDRQTLVVRRAYGQLDDAGESGFCMYGDSIPWCDESAAGDNGPLHRRINDFFRDARRIDLNNGDAVLMIGPLNCDVAYRELEKTLARINPENGAQNHRILAEFVPAA